MSDSRKLLGWAVAGLVVIYLAWMGAELAASWHLRPWPNLLAAALGFVLLPTGLAALFLVRGLAVLRRGQTSSAMLGFLIALAWVSLPTAGMLVAPHYESEG